MIAAITWAQRPFDSNENVDFGRRERWRDDSCHKPRNIGTLNGCAERGEHGGFLCRNGERKTAHTGIACGVRFVILDLLVGRDSVMIYGDHLRVAACKMLCLKG